MPSSDVAVRGGADAPGSGLRLRVDELAHPAVHALLEEHLDEMRRLSPPESVHALDLAALRAPDITFWSAWDAGVLVGIAALKALAPDHGEIKSMRTPAAIRRRGAASALLEHIIDVARDRGYRRLSLETGSGVAFLPARTLYVRHGFAVCGPFGDYVEDPESVFMTREV